MRTRWWSSWRTTERPRNVTPSPVSTGPPRPATAAIRYAGRFEPGPEATWGYIGSYWASAASTPYRYWKAEEFEGGCHTPMIVQWPKGLKSPAGSITGQMGHVIDLMPTFLELAGWPAIAVYSFSGGGCSLTRTYCWGQKSPASNRSPWPPRKGWPC